MLFSAGSQLYTESSLSLGGGDPLVRTLDNAAVQLNLPGHYVLLEHDQFKVQATVDYVEAKDAVYNTAFTRIAFASKADSAKYEVKLEQSDRLSFAQEIANQAVYVKKQGLLLNFFISHFLRFSFVYE